ncbi:50S ribosomal protein L9 [Buchnera aphidicola (Nipponaphis monzeni)]|uniref:Large ribosomal subunit protein bL9 n=1 Tax=Buchnera aphidicola (Nipponaphis monzeni) TaxID=2495405 RepID=A0A455TAR4_9GAMM|nr:50S ribosomal protein L9 [Buchnera aphidicola]BBI01428.1 50S ribosomal protein L9 [Buchnera aphidicola (Nipponaphis monzeni)]
MKVILMTNMKKLGLEGEIVNVKSGYARNFLIPKEKVILATKNNIKILKVKKYELQLKVEKAILYAKKRIELIVSLGNIKVYSKSGKEGKLFGSINRKDIIKKINLLGCKISKNEINILNGPIRTLGRYKVIFEPYININTTFDVEVIAQK